MSKKNLLISLFVFLATGAAFGADGGFSATANRAINATDGSRGLISTAAPEEYGVRVDKVEVRVPDGSVLLDVDRPDRVYEADDHVLVTVKSSKPGYLYLLNVDSKGEAALLIPNRYFQDNRIAANEETTYPTAKMGFNLTVSGPSFGRETLKAFIADEPIEELDQKGAKSTIAELSERDMKSLGQELVGRIKSINVEPTECPASPFLTAELEYQTVAKGDRPAAPVDKTGRRIVLIFAVGHYADPTISTLMVCANDAKQLKKTCVKHLGVAENDVAVFNDQLVTYDNVRAVFKELARVSKAGDEIFIFWTGHGGRAAATSEYQSSDSQMNFLVPYDGDTNDVYNTMITENAFGQWINELNGRKIALFLDACHSGGMAGHAKSKSLSGGASLMSQLLPGDKSAQADEPFEFTFCFNAFSASKDLGQKDLFILASSTGSEQSFVGDELSVMTRFLIEAIEDASKYATHKDLKEKIKPEVEKYVKTRYPGATQTVVSQDDLNPGLILKK